MLSNTYINADRYDAEYRHFHQEVKLAMIPVSHLQDICQALPFSHAYLVKFGPLSEYHRESELSFDPNLARIAESVLISGFTMPVINHTLYEIKKGSLCDYRAQKLAYCNEIIPANMSGDLFLTTPSGEAWRIELAETVIGNDFHFVEVIRNPVADPHLINLFKYLALHEGCPGIATIEDVQFDDLSALGVSE